MSISSVNLNNLSNIIGLPQGTVATLSGNATMVGLSDTALAHVAGDINSPFLVMSTGIASEVTNANTSGSQGTDIGATGTDDDTVTLTFNVPKPDKAKAFGFEFSFLSEEYPEFVGSQFNDYFSVKVNGVEIAYDTSGNAITVNNDFFSDTLPPIGTLFDGQTPPLLISSPIGNSPDNLIIELEIADVGDGIYDSAAFVKDFKFYETQIVYVQFDKGTIDFSSFINNQSGFELPASGLSSTQENEILSIVNNIYDDFLIEFVKDKPSSGDYSTIHVGGTHLDIPSWIGAEADSSLAGQAEKLDYGNADKNDVAYVLSGQTFFNDGGTPDIDEIAQVLAHEAGHILGLRHIADNMELMYPFAGENRTAIGREEQLAGIDTNGELVTYPYYQDSYFELAKNLGLKNNSQLGVSDQVISNKLNKYVNVNVNSSADTIYGVTFVIANDEGEVLSTEKIGDIDGNTNLELLIPLVEGDKFILIGKTQENGGFDVFLTPGGVSNFKLSTASQFEIINEIGVFAGELNAGQFSIVQSASDGNLTSIGFASTQLIDASNLEATEGADILDGSNENNIILGLGGNDQINGLGGDDQLFGNDGNDYIDGGADNDIVRGGAGNDILIGGLGDDILTGGNANISDFGTQGIGIENFSLSMGWSSFDEFPRLLGDVDGDGDADIIGFGNSRTYSSLSNGDGTFQELQTTQLHTAVVNYGKVQGWSSFDEFPRLIGDFDGDGNDDIIGFGNSRTFTSLSNGDSTFASAQTGIVNFSKTQGWTSFDDFPRLIGDVNGDGYDDIVGFGNSKTFTAFSNGDGTFSAAQTAINNFSKTQGWTSFDEYPRLLGDFDGDGDADIVGFGNSKTFTSLSNGNGTFSAAQVAIDNYSVEDGWSSFDSFPISVADINGDGLDDLVGFGSKDTFAATSNGDGTFAVIEPVLDNFNAAQGWTSFDTFPRFSGDVDGDGADDLVGFGSVSTLVHFATPDKDTFVFVNDIFGQDKITDFEDGKDIIDLSQTSFSFSDLQIFSINSDQDTMIDAPGSGNDITLENVSSSLITQEDFII